MELQVPPWCQLRYEHRPCTVLGAELLHSSHKELLIITGFTKEAKKSRSRPKRSPQPLFYA